jgi:hypothetical protein
VLSAHAQCELGCRRTPGGRALPKFYEQEDFCSLIALRRGGGAGGAATAGAGFFSLLGGTLGGIEWGSAADLSNVYVAVSDMVRIAIPNSIGTEVDPKQGGGMFALNLEKGQRVWFMPAPGCDGAEPATAREPMFGLAYRYAPYLKRNGP